MSGHAIPRGVLAAVVSVAVGSPGRSLAKGAPAPQSSAPVKPADAAANPSVADLLAELRKKPREKLTPIERARRAGVEFCLALAVGDGRAATAHVDAIGYQPLPLSGPLPLDPPRLIPVDELARWIDRRPDSNAADAPARLFEIRTRRQCESSFPAVATWMLPRDYVLVIEPPGPRIHDWITRRACLVIRVRGRRATIVGGNLVEALLSAESSSETAP